MLLDNTTSLEIYHFISLEMQVRFVFVGSTFGVGHLAPMDLPGPSLDMVKRFIHDKSFEDVVLPSECTLSSLCYLLYIAFYTTLIVDDVEDSIGVDDTVKSADDDNEPVEPSTISLESPITPPNIPKETDAYSTSHSSLLILGTLGLLMLHPLVLGFVAIVIVGILSYARKNYYNGSQFRSVDIPLYLIICSYTPISQQNYQESSLNI